MPRNFRRKLGGKPRRFSVVDRESPKPGRFDAVIVTGSRASAYCDERWVAETGAWVRRALERGVPALGIRWGHQLLAGVLGGTVESMGEYELGYRTVKHRGAALFDGVPEEFIVFITHSDAITEVPDRAEVIAENDYGIHGFRYGTVYEFQSHPEYDPETAESVVRGTDLPEERIEAVRSEIRERTYEAAKPAKRVSENFSQLLRSERERAIAADWDGSV